MAPHMAATILLVEDEAEIRRFAAEALRDRGCTVIEAENGIAGLNLLRALIGASHGSIDVLVADVGLPGGLNGRQLADAARDLAPELPVLLITGLRGGGIRAGGGVGQRHGIAEQAVRA